MTVYILNTSILPNFGTYTFRKVSLEEAKELLRQNKFVSAVGHEATAQFLSCVLGVYVPRNRLEIVMRKGDKALVFKLLRRLPEGKVLSLEELNSYPYELGILERIA